jgi:hypothetical protein
MTINTIVFAGCGALGSLIASHLNCDPSIEYLLIDDDVVEESNIGTSVYETVQVGTPKVQALGTLLYRRNRRKCKIHRITFTMGVIGLVGGDNNLIIDTFDNPRSRNITKWLTANVLHCGVSPDFTGSILWDEVCPEFEVEFERGESQFCTRQVGAQILRLTAMYSCLVIEEFLRSGTKINRGVTLK